MDQPLVILDTNIVSYYFNANSLGFKYHPFMSGKMRAVSFITLGEMYFGAQNNGWGASKRSELESMLSGFKIIHSDDETASIYGYIVAERRKRGNAIDANDAWIAACAIRHTAPLITHNAKDFIHIDSLDVVSLCLNDLDKLHRREK